MDHDEAVEKHYRQAKEAVSRGSYWDDVYKETSYFEAYTSPIDSVDEDKGLEVGEFDVLLVNYDDQVAMYKEIKTGGSSMRYADEQIERAREFFEDTEWSVFGSKFHE